MGKPKTQRSLKDNEAKAVLRMLRTSGIKLNLVAAMIRFRPAALIFRLALGFAGGASLFLSSAQRFRCAVATRARPAALIPRLRLPLRGFDGSAAQLPADLCNSFLKDDLLSLVSGKGCLQQFRRGNILDIPLTSIIRIQVAAHPRLHCGYE